MVVIGTGGETTAIIGTAQGARIAWDGGETNDIVGELNQRLAFWRAREGVGGAAGD